MVPSLLSHCTEGLHSSAFVQLTQVNSDPCTPVLPLLLHLSCMLIGNISWLHLQFEVTESGCIHVAATKQQAVRL